MLQSHRILSLAGLALLTACAKGGSTSGIPTNEISATFTLKADSSGKVTCTASLTHGTGIGATSLELAAGERVHCSDGDTDVTLEEAQNLLGEVQYSISSLTYTPSKIYQMTYVRYNGEKLVASATLPPAITILSPAAGTQATKGQPLSVSWDPTSNDDIQVMLDWSIGAPSGHVGPTKITDVGTHMFSSSQTLTHGENGDTYTGNATAKITLTRIRAGVHPSGLQGSTEAQQESTVSLTLKD